MDNRAGALAGVKVIDLGHVATVPWLTSMYFGCWGATVIRIETHSRPDIQRLGKPYKNGIVSVNTSGFYARHNSSKYSVSIDFTKSKGQELVLKLIHWADIVCEGLTPGTLAKYKLDYDSVKNIRPDIIYLSTSMLGGGGPHSNFRGYGHNAAALTGLNYFTGWPDDPPSSLWGAFTDYMTPRFAAAVLLAALDYKRRTGIGQYIDISQAEVGLMSIAPLVMSYGKTVDVPTRTGNHVPYAAPHNVYPCQGNDSWVAITVCNDNEWTAFGKAMGEPEWWRDQRFTTLANRKNNEAALDKSISEWTINYDAERIADLMQSHGVSSFVVQNVAEVFDDPQLAHRNHFQIGNHSVMGQYHMDAPATRLSLTPHKQFAAPALGEHNEFVFHEILGISDEEIADLMVQGAITTDGDLPVVGSAA